MARNTLAMDQVKVALNSYRAGGLDDYRLPDVIGDLAAAERALRDFRQGLLAEVDRPLEGGDYRLVATTKTSRSYNTPALLAAFTPEGGRLSDTVAQLVANDVVRLQWQYSKLKRAAYDAGLVLLPAPWEIEDGAVTDDGDPIHIGEVRDTRYEPKPKTND